LSTSGHDRSEKQDRAKVGNHRQGDDPRPTPLLHPAMMLDGRISAQPKREG